MPDVLSAILRAASFVLLFQAAGVAIFIAVFGRLLGSSLQTIRRIGFWAALVAIPVVAGQQALEPARMAGDWSGMLDGALQAMAWNSSVGAAIVLRIAALIVLAARPARQLAMESPRPTTAGSGGSIARSALPLAGVLLAATSFTLTGHTVSHAFRWLSAPLLATHVIIVAFWFGSLLPLVIASKDEPSPVAAEIVERFSAIAIWVVPLILAAGVGMAVVLVPNLAVFARPYGELLIAKVALFTALMGLAALNKWRYGPAIAVGESGALAGFQRTVLTEYVFIIAVLCVTDVMTLLYSPE